MAETKFSKDEIAQEQAIYIADRARAALGADIVLLVFAHRDRGSMVANAFDREGPNMVQPTEVMQAAIVAAENTVRLCSRGKCSILLKTPGGIVDSDGEDYEPPA